MGKIIEPQGSVYSYILYTCCVLNNNLMQQPQWIEDSTGKITGYKTPGGADTVFPFSSSIYIPRMYVKGNVSGYTSSTFLQLDVSKYSKIEIGSLNTNGGGTLSFRVLAGWVSSTSGDNLYYKSCTKNTVVDDVVDISSQECITLALSHTNASGNMGYVDSITIS